MDFSTILVVAAADLPCQHNVVSVVLLTDEAGNVLVDSGGLELTEV